jgi:serine/threonine protein kinase
MPVQPKKDLMSMLKEGNVGKEDLKSLQNFKDFLEKALALDPNKRITPEEALGHPFIQISQYKTKTSTQTTTGSTQILHSNKTVKGKNVKRNQY